MLNNPLIKKHGFILHKILVLVRLHCRSKTWDRKSFYKNVFTIFLFTKVAFIGPKIL